MLAAILDRLPRPRTNIGLATIFDGFVLFTRLTEGRTLEERSEADTRGFEGAVLYEITGDGGGHWHCVIGAGTVHFHRGVHPAPRATVLLSVDDFFRMLSGDLSFMVAQMTGRLRIQGDGHASILVGALFTQIRQARAQSGAVGRVARLWSRLALRASGTGYRFAEPEGNAP